MVNTYQTTSNSQSDVVESDPNSYLSFQRKIFGSLTPPLFTTDPLAWQSLAQKKVPATHYGYVSGSAGTGSTDRANVSAFDRYRLRPRRLIDTTRRDLSIDLFGEHYPSPILAAPIGVQTLMHKDGEEATARACRDLNIPMILSTAATRTIEEVAEASGDGPRWFQLYWPRPDYNDITASLLRRAKDNGYTTLVVTLDTFEFGWRPTDLDTSFTPFIWGQGCQIGHSDPAFNRYYNELLENDHRSVREKLDEAFETVGWPTSLSNVLRMASNASILRKSKAWLDVAFAGIYHTWDQLETLKEHWDGPIVLKGILTAEDARLAIEHGVSGIIVSNHGGRQIDGAIASIDALADITADPVVKESGIPVLFDSGIRSGSDIIKALALGAKAVLIGRPYVYGLAIGGEEGVKHVMKCLLADADCALSNTGKRNLQELSRDDLDIWRHGP